MAPPTAQGLAPPTAQGLAPSLQEEFLGDSCDGAVVGNGNYKSKVTVVGSGNWGSVTAKLIASNTLNLDSFHDEVRMWVFEETLPSGEKLVDVINRENENVKYLPGIKLGKNVVAACSEIIRWEA